MATRFERLFQLPANQYIEGSPVILAAGALLKDTESGSIVAQLKFQSVSEKYIKAVKVSLDAYDVSKSEVQGVTDYQYLELNVTNGQEFGSNKAIVMPASVTRSFAVSSIVVVFADGTMWKNASTLVMLKPAKSLNFGNMELEKQYRIATNSSAKYVPCENMGLWQCACGVWNRGYNCTHCKNYKESVFSALNIAVLTERMNARLASEAEQKRIASEEALERRRKQEAKKHVLVKRVKIATAIIIPVLIIALLFSQWILPDVIQPAIAYSKAEKMLATGQYDDAIETFKTLGDYRDSVSRIEEAKEGILANQYSAAEQLLASAQYEAAIKAFQDLGDYRDCQTRIEEAREAINAQKYASAEQLLYSGQYEAAIKAFLELGDYKDSVTKIAECETAILENKYSNAIKLMGSGEFETAAAVFESIAGYKDSNSKLSECRDRIIEAQYNEAVALASQGLYDEAIEILISLGNYKNAAELSKEYMLVNCESGDIITFGNYEQDGNLTNGSEEIEWIVLMRDGNKAFVISKYCLEQMPFNSTYMVVSWKNSTIRAWLNGDFYSGAFSSQEKNRICNVTFSTDGIETTDKVFLLDEEEASYLPKSIRKAEATDYVSTSYCYWFLRSTGSASNVAYVSYDGEVGYYEDVDRNWWVRPAMWIVVDQ